MSTIAIDTSVAVPLLVQTHDAHPVVKRWWQGRTVALSGHALVECYAVLTRLPAELRVSPREAAWLLREQFAVPATLSAAATAELPDVLSDLGIAGGAVYDALVGLAAVEHGMQLATRDARAKATYDAVGARVIIVA